MKICNLLQLLTITNYNTHPWWWDKQFCTQNIHQDPLAETVFAKTVIIASNSVQLAKKALTLKRLGGGLKGPPPRHFARLLCNAQSSRRDTLWLFSFKFPAHFDTKFVTPGGTVLNVRNFLYMHVGPKMARKCDFVYKINANWLFPQSSYKYAYFYSQWLKLICFSIIVLQKVSATNFTEKNNKNKRSKKQRNT